MASDGPSLLYRRAGTGLPKKDLRDFARTLRDDVAEGRPFTCLVTDDAELERLNRMFFRKDYPTDVLSFPSADGGDAVGEIAISVDRAREQAAEHGHSTDAEIKILMLHGLLHLLGMDHERDRGTMARMEDRWRKRLGLPTALIARARQVTQR